MLLPSYIPTSPEPGKDTGSFACEFRLIQFLAARVSCMVFAGSMLVLKEGRTAWFKQPGCWPEFSEFFLLLTPTW